MLIKFNNVGVSEMKALKQTTDYLFLQQTNCDIRFYFEDGQHIGGNVNILSARSPVFAAMFNHDMQEAKPYNNNKNTKNKPSSYSNLPSFVFTDGMIPNATFSSI
jgi:hypothetical protein